MTSGSVNGNPTPDAIQINREEVLENIWTALKLIGIKSDDTFYLIIPITDTKVKLPSWIDNIERVLYINNKDVTLEDIDGDLNYYLSDAENVSLTDKFILDRETNDTKYIIKGNYLHINKNNGYLIVIYTALSLDEEGEPLIEDEVNLIEALVWFNVKELLWQLTIKNPSQYAALSQKAESEWRYYSVNAKTASIFPKNKDSLINLRNTYLKILPNFKK